MTLRRTFASLAAAAAITGALAAPGIAAPLSATPAGARAAADSHVTNVQYRGRAFGARHHRGFGPGFVAGAVVGAATAPLWAFGGAPYAYEDGYGYAEPAYPRRPHFTYNRYSGQVQGPCVIDDGYGRTRPCNAGSS